MRDYSMVDTAVSMGGVVARAIDLETGEILPLDSSRAWSKGSRTPSGNGDQRGGLSTAHICTFLDGGLVKVVRKEGIGGQVGGGKRGIITGFSMGSRRRLMRMIAKTRKSELPAFVTLTYPGEFTEDPLVWKKNLRAFFARMKRKYPQACAIWKLEFQKRGAPHYHLLVWGVEWYKLLDFVPSAWYKVVKSGDIRHLLAGTQVQRVRSWRGVMAYASKYLGKLGSVPSDAPGRFWGVMAGECIPWAQMIETALSDRQAVKLLRILRRLMGIKGRDYCSLTAFADGSFFHDRLQELII